MAIAARTRPARPSERPGPRPERGVRVYEFPDSPDASRERALASPHGAVGNRAAQAAARLGVADRHVRAGPHAAPRPRHRADALDGPSRRLALPAPEPRRTRLRPKPRL